MELRSEAHLLKIQAVKINVLLVLRVIPKFCPNRRSWSNCKIEHLINKTVIMNYSIRLSFFFFFYQKFNLTVRPTSIGVKFGNNHTWKGISSLPKNLEFQVSPIVVFHTFNLRFPQVKASKDLDTTYFRESGCRLLVLTERISTKCTLHRRDKTKMVRIS